MRTNTLICVYLCSSAALFSALAKDVSFTASAVKPVNLFTLKGGAVPIQISPTAFRCVCSLQTLITTAFQMKRDSIVFPRNLMESDSYQVSATFPEAANAEVPLMLQTLLHERFHLVAHREQREALIYALVEAPGGMKLHRTPPPASIEGAIRHPQHSTLSASLGNRVDRLKISGSGTLGEIATAIRIDRPVINMTGVTGRFDYAIDAVIPARAGAFTLGAPVTETSPDDPPSIFSVMKRFGLLLEPRKTMQEFLIIDKLQKAPTAN